MVLNVNFKELIMETIVPTTVVSNFRQLTPIVIIPTPRKNSLIAAGNAIETIVEPNCEIGTLLCSPGKFVFLVGSLICGTLEAGFLVRRRLVTHHVRRDTACAGSYCEIRTSRITQS